MRKKAGHPAPTDKGVCSVVITSIDGSVSAAFERLLPADWLRRVLDGKAFGLGAVCEDGDAPRAVGVLVFAAEEGSNGAEDLTAAVIRWLYVDSAFRCRGTGEALMREFFRVMDDAGVEHILCDVPMPAEYNELCAYLESWGFGFVLTDVYEVETTLGAAAAAPAIASAPASAALPLSRVTGSSFQAFLARVRQLDSAPDDLDARETYYDQTLSCAEIRDGAIDGALLIHVSEQRELEIELLRSLSGSPHALADMTAYTVRAAGTGFSGDTPLRFLCRSDMARNVTASLFPGLQPLLVRRGYYDNGPQQAEEEAQL